MRTTMTRVMVILLLLADVAPPAEAQVDQQRAQEFFKEAQALCERDGGRLWGVSICAPMVIGDARTQTFATSQPPPDAPRPNTIGLLNGPIRWGDTLWAAMTWETIANWPAGTRGEAFLHESFHIVQMSKGIATPDRSRLGPNSRNENEHLDAVDGRYWLRLEWRALARALRESGEPRAQAVREALAFRRSRLARYPEHVVSEYILDINEGLASYTQVVLAAPSGDVAIARALELLAGAEDGESYVRTFAYSSGPAYGLLLDAAAPGWPQRMRPGDEPAELLMRALGVQPAAAAAAAALRYGGAELRATEEQRDRQRQARIAELRRRFVEGPVLVMPGGGRGLSNSLGALVIPDVGTIYFHAYRMTGPWGELEADSGVLVSSDGRARHLPAPVQRNETTVSGAGWTLKIAPGWVVREGARRGDFEVVQASARQSPVTTDVVYGHKDGMALTFDVHRPARPNGAGVIAIVSGGYQSSVEMSRQIVGDYLAPLLNENGFTVFAVRHGSSPRYPLPAIVSDVRRAVRFIRQHAGDYGVESNRIGVWGASAGGQLALLLGTTADSGDPSASDATLREPSRIAAVVAFYAPTDLWRFENRRSVPALAALTEAQAGQYSPIRFVSSGAAPSLIVHGDADDGVPIIHGESMHAALIEAGVPASFLRIAGAGHAFGGADLERINPAVVRWFERHLGSAAK
ncbi:MAG: alpha/beta hydrolase [Blastocatellales bacterium]|nr:alpha/beta hydrolase [Blastocatellales bacterium]